MSTKHFIGFSFGIGLAKKMQAAHKILISSWLKIILRTSTNVKQPLKDVLSKEHIEFFTINIISTMINRSKLNYLVHAHDQLHFLKGRGVYSEGLRPCCTINRLPQFPMFTSRSACNIFNQTAASLPGWRGSNTYVQRATRRANILATNDYDDGDKSHKFKSHLSALENYAAKTVCYKQRQQLSQQQQLQ